MVHKGSSPPRLILVDQSLAEAGGHHITYNMSLAKAAEARGLTAIVLANLFADPTLRSLPGVRPTFSSAWFADQRPYGLVPAGAEVAPVRDLFADELFGALDQLRAGAADHVFLHTIGFHEVGEILRAILGRDPQYLPVLHILCRRDLREAPDGSPRRREFEFSIAALARNRARGIDIRFYTDTPQLSLQYATATGVAFETLPLPFPTYLIAARLDAARLARATRTQTRLCYLGDARDEKGFQHLPQAIARVAPNLVAAGAFHFTLQSNFNVAGGEPLSGPARGKLRAAPASLVSLRPAALSEHDYYDVLCASDAVIVPYDVTCYQNRSSGIFTEALHAEAIPVVPAGTSMAAQLPAGFPTVFQSPRELPRVFETIHRDKERLRAEIVHLAADWRRVHTPEGIIDRLLQGPPNSLLFDATADLAYTHTRPALSQLPAKSPVVVVQIDLESFHYRIGAARTMKLQIVTLRGLGCAVYAIAVVHNHLDEAAQETSRPSFWSHVLNAVAAQLELAGAWLCWNGRVRPEGTVGLEEIVVYRRNTTVPQGLRAFLEVTRPAFVLVNYPQSISVIDKLGVRDIPVVIETHDIQSAGIALASADTDYERSLAREAQILNRAEMVSCVTEEDAEALRNLGVSRARACIPTLPAVCNTEDIFAGIQDLSELLAAGGSNASDVDIETAWRSNQTAQIRRLHNERFVDLLFIGSWHRPNIEGFDWFYNEVFLPYLEPQGVNCFVVGGICAEKQRFPSERIYWGGVQRDLGICLAAARIVIAPLLEGTGINVKVLEAIESGKPIVATRIALRGIPGAEHALQAFDDPLEFAHQIQALLASRSKRERLVDTTRRLARDLRAENDYARHYAPMLPDAPVQEAAAPQPLDEAGGLIEYTLRHERTNRLIRMMTEKGAWQTDAYKYIFNNLGKFHNADLLKCFIHKLFVTRDAPILAIEGFEAKHDIQTFAGESTSEALFKIAARLVQETSNLTVSPAVSMLGAKTIGEVLVRAGGDAKANDHLALLCDNTATAGNLAKIADEGFDIVLWFGPQDWGQDAAAWIYNQVIRTSPAFRDRTILVPGIAAKHSFLDGHVFFCGPIEDTRVLPLLGKVIILCGAAHLALHPDWLRTALIAAAAGNGALAVDMTIFGDNAPPSLLADKTAWETALTARLSRPRGQGGIPKRTRELIRASAPRLATWLEEVAATDVTWSSWLGEVGSLLVPPAPAGGLTDGGVDRLAGLATTPRRQRTISLQLQSLRRRIEEGGEMAPIALDKLADRLAEMEHSWEVSNGTGLVQ